MAEYNFQTFKQMNLSGVTVTEFALVFRANESLQCISHRIFPCISNKQMCNSHRLDFVFDKQNCQRTSQKIFKMNSLASSLYSYF